MWDIHYINLSNNAMVGSIHWTANHLNGHMDSTWIKILYNYLSEFVRFWAGDCERSIMEST